jgi:hypothetical protein
MHAFDDDLTSATRTAKEAEHSGPEGAEAAGARSSSGADAVLHLQRTAGNAGVAQLLASEEDPHGLQRLVGSGGGSALPPSTQVQMESALGADFSGVRVHTGSDADASARSLGAHAYTAGNDVVFANGRYDPDSSDGRRTLAHELTHVVQQRSGPVSGTDNGSGVKVSDPSDSFEQEAEASADRVMAGQTTDVSADEGDTAVQGMFVQREAAEEGEMEEPEEAGDAGAEMSEEPAEEAAEEETVQTLAVQREADEGEMEEPEEAAG